MGVRDRKFEIVRPRQDLFETGFKTEVTNKFVRLHTIKGLLLIAQELSNNYRINVKV